MQSVFKYIEKGEEKRDFVRYLFFTGLKPIMKFLN
jgi:hypothetical protein